MVMADFSRGGMGIEGSLAGYGPGAPVMQSLESLFDGKPTSRQPESMFSDAANHLSDSDIKPGPSDVAMAETDFSADGPYIQVFRLDLTERTSNQKYHSVDVDGSTFLLAKTHTHLVVVHVPPDSPEPLSVFLAVAKEGEEERRRFLPLDEYTKARSIVSQANLPPQVPVRMQEYRGPSLSPPQDMQSQLSFHRDSPSTRFLVHYRADFTAENLGNRFLLFVTYGARWWLCPVYSNYRANRNALTAAQQAASLAQSMEAPGRPAPLRKSSSGRSHMAAWSPACNGPMENTTPPAVLGSTFSPIEDASPQPHHHQHHQQLPQQQHLQHPPQLPAAVRHPTLPNSSNFTPISPIHPRPHLDPSTPPPPGSSRPGPSAPAAPHSVPISSPEHAPGAGSLLSSPKPLERHGAKYIAGLGFVVQFARAPGRELKLSEAIAVVSESSVLCFTGECDYYIYKEPGWHGIEVCVVDRATLHPIDGTWETFFFEVVPVSNPLPQLADMLGQKLLSGSGLALARAGSASVPLTPPHYYSSLPSPRHQSIPQPQPQPQGQPGRSFLPPSEAASLNHVSTSSSTSSVTSRAVQQPSTPQHSHQQQQQPHPTSSPTGHATHAAMRAHPSSASSAPPQPPVQMQPHLSAPFSSSINPQPLPGQAPGQLPHPHQQHSHGHPSQQAQHQHQLQQYQHQLPHQHHVPVRASGPHPHSAAQPQEPSFIQYAFHQGSLLDDGDQSDSGLSDPSWLGLGVEDMRDYIPNWEI